MNARQKAKKLKQENEYLKERFFDYKRDEIKLTRIPTEHYKAQFRIPKNMRPDELLYVRTKLAQQLAESFEAKIKVELCEETVKSRTYCSEILVAFDV